MRSILLASILLLGLATAAMAQAAPAMAPVSSSGDVAFTYHWLRTNAPDGQCGCFDLNGGGVSGSWNLRSRWALVAEVSAEHAGNTLSTGNSLTCASPKIKSRSFFALSPVDRTHESDWLGRLTSGTRSRITV